MQCVNLGQTGLKVSRVVLGCMSYGGKWYRDFMIDEKGARSHYKKALDLGINFFDTADTYSNGESELITGKWLLKYASRDDLVIASKLHSPMGPGQNSGGLSRKHIMEGIDASLKRLGTDYLDLYQIHRFDEDTPIAETLEALHDVVRSGKVLYIGASSMYAYQFTKMLYTADLNGWTRFVSMQNHYNLIYREEEREMMPLCEEEGVGVIPWAPLAKGYLSGKRKRRCSHEAGQGRSPFAPALSLRQQLRHHRSSDIAGEKAGGDPGSTGDRLDTAQAVRHRPDNRRYTSLAHQRCRGGHRHRAQPQGSDVPRRVVRASRGLGHRTFWRHPALSRREALIRNSPSGAST